MAGHAGCGCVDRHGLYPTQARTFKADANYNACRVAIAGGVDDSVGHVAPHLDL